MQDCWGAVVAESSALAELRGWARAWDKGGGGVVFCAAMEAAFMQDAWVAVIARASAWAE